MLIELAANERAVHGDFFNSKFTKRRFILSYPFDVFPCKLKQLSVCPSPFATLVAHPCCLVSLCVYRASFFLSIKGM